MYVGLVQGNEAHVKLLEHKFVSKKPYRCSPTDRKEIENQIANLLKHSLIEESCSAFAAHITLVYKKDGDERTKDRLCIDFSELNQLVVPEPQPFPIIY